MRVGVVVASSSGLAGRARVWLACYILTRVQLSYLGGALIVGFLRSVLPHKLPMPRSLSLSCVFVCPSVCLRSGTFSCVVECSSGSLVFGLLGFSLVLQQMHAMGRH